MDELIGIFLVLGLVGIVFGGSVSGIFALLRGNKLSRQMRGVQTTFSTLSRRLAALEGRLSKEGEAQTLDTVDSDGDFVPLDKLEAMEPAREQDFAHHEVPIAEEKTADLSTEARAGSLPPPLPPSRPRSFIDSLPRDQKSLEMLVGAKWMSWVGILMVLVGTGLFLKFAYDNDWIGPLGRLAIGVLFGLTALGLGEYVRRKDWNPLFQTLTGGGIAIFYICVFYSFRFYGTLTFYELTGAQVSFALAILITVLGVVMAVAHKALPIAFIAVLGGFLSPFIFGEGGKHPYVLFSYVVILDFVAFGSAYYRRWRALDILSFVGTVATYQAWYVGAYEEGQIAPALLYTTIFYLMFLAIPMVYALVHKEHQKLDGLTLVIANAFYSVYAYYSLLYADYHRALGFVIIGQALLVFGLFRAWTLRVGTANRTAPSLLVIALALATLAVPLQLQAYGIAVAWAVEGALLAYVGLRFKSPLVKGASAVALVLSSIRLLMELPLHAAPFVPVLNVAFGSWVLVIAGASVASWLYLREEDAENSENRILGAGAGLLAYVLGCSLLTMEVSRYWVLLRPDGFRQLQFNSLVLLWTAIPVGAAAVVHFRKLKTEMWAVVWGSFAVGALVFFISIGRYEGRSELLFLEPGFLFRAAFVAGVWWVAQWARRSMDRPAPWVLETAGHLLLTLLLAVEFGRWGHTSQLVSDRFALALLSAAWAVQAVGLIWAGLKGRVRLRRLLGLLLFGLTVAKVIVVDMQEVGREMQIVSFVASGVLLLVGAAFYQRFSKEFLAEESEEDVH